jgi:hypothetical protein
MKIRVTATGSELDTIFNPNNPFGTETIREFLNRHSLTLHNGWLHFWHGTPSRGKHVSKFDELREGSFLATNPDEARYYAARDRNIKQSSVRVLSIWLKPQELGYCGHYYCKIAVPLTRPDAPTSIES